MPSPLIHLITGGTPGLIHDAELAATVLRGKFPIALHASRRRNLQLLHRRVLLGLRGLVSKRTNIGIFFENLPTAWVKAVDRCVLIPNQEWIWPEVEKNIGRCHEVWCKTHYAEDIFRKRGFRTRYIGFTSKDMFLPDVPKNFNAFVHVAGRSELKGTSTLLKVWQRHPEWPKVTVISRHPYLLRHTAPNIEIITEYLDDHRLRVLMNTAGVHLCPSETEGFGHYINEALSTAGLVITTDASPMNELVSSDIGVLVPYADVQRQNYSERFLVDANALEQAIDAIVRLPIEEKQAMARRARQSFLDRNTQFDMEYLRLTELITEKDLDR